MENFCYYLCCFGCFGLFGRKKFVKITPEMSRKKRYLDLLDKIASEQKAMPVISDPTERQIVDLTNIHTIPSTVFHTEESLLNWYGFRINERVASGSFADVYNARHMPTDTQIACKIIKVGQEVDLTKKATDKNKDIKKFLTEDKKVSRIKDVKNELYALQKLKHPNVVKMIRHFIVFKDERFTLYVFMQFAKGGTLSRLTDNFGPFDENACRHWFAQILSAMNFMHSEGIAHRDLKLANILLDDSQEALISDFGLSRVAYRRSHGGLIESNTYCGTPPFMAPELLEGKKYNAFLVDVWALGVILYRMFNREYPFVVIKDRKYKAIQQMKAKHWKFSNSVLHNPSKGLKDILTKILEPDTNWRPTMNKLRKHYWIKKEYKLVDKNFKRFTSKSTNTQISMKTTVKEIFNI